MHLSGFFSRQISSNGIFKQLVSRPFLPSQFYLSSEGPPLREMANSSNIFHSNLPIPTLMTGQQEEVVEFPWHQKQQFFYQFYLEIGCGCLVSGSCQNQRGRSIRSAFLHRSGFIALGIRQRVLTILRQCFDSTF